MEQSYIIGSKEMQIDDSYGFKHKTGWKQTNLKVAYRAKSNTVVYLINFIPSK